MARISTSQRTLVTGGSGFIGTNVVASLLARGAEVRSLDAQPPACEDHRRVFRQVDLLDADAMREAFAEFQPVHVIHLAARTDLDGADVDAYPANTTGVGNLIAALARTPSVQRCVFTSTKLVCPNDHAVRSFDEYCPETDYGRSKVVSEKIIKQSASLSCEWCIVRPTGIWGPWFHVPYRGFFLMVARGRYIHPRGTDAPKSFGYVGNVVFQIEALLNASREKIHEQTFYLSDYEP